MTSNQTALPMIPAHTEPPRAHKHRLLTMPTDIPNADLAPIRRVLKRLRARRLGAHRERVRTVEYLHDAAIERPDMYPPVGAARVDVLLAGRLRGAEVAANERPEHFVTRILHDAAVERVCLVLRPRVGAAPGRKA